MNSKSFHTLTQNNHQVLQNIEGKLQAMSMQLNQLTITNQFNQVPPALLMILKQHKYLPNNYQYFHHQSMAAASHQPNIPAIPKSSGIENAVDNKSMETIVEKESQ